ncbi:DUOX2-like protein [Mya arenaria]|uniref:DUOX2-like protein n=1 Tax=Mya arenaria TaxID=6604 RepID=A0ABY7DUN3_MYAAR|nr:DUOX2-like protein [Mya arenaria]
MYFTYMPVVTLLIMLLLAKHRRSSIYRTRVLPQPLQRTTSSNVNEFRALEWVDNENPERIVSVVLEPEESKISVYNTQKVLLRFADVGALPAGEARDGPVKSGDLELHLSSDHDENLIAVKLPEYDLVLNFHDREERDRFAHRLTLFIEARHLKVTRRHLQKSYILRSAVTRKFRQERLNKFFKKILGAEFGEAFGMRPSSMFVKHMFMLVDKDKSGRVSFREFLDIFILLSSDDIESKIRLLFNMYDLESRGYLAGEDVEKMIRSLLDLSEDASEQRVQEFLTAVYREAGLRVGQEMTFDNFRRVFATGNYAQTIKNASLGLNDSDADNDQAASPTSPIAGARMSRRRSTLLKGYSSLVSQSTQVNQEPEKKSKFLLPPTRPPPRKVRTPSISGAAKQATLSHSPESEIAGQGLAEGREGVQAMWDKMVSYCETNRLQIFWVTLYCLLCAGIFLERAVCHGVTMSRGSASVIMFTYSGLLLTMCKNMITALRETVLNRVIPFDSFHQMHKIIACISLAFTDCRLDWFVLLGYPLTFTFSHVSNFCIVSVAHCVSRVEPIPYLHPALHRPQLLPQGVLPGVRTLDFIILRMLKLFAFAYLEGKENKFIFFQDVIQMCNFSHELGSFSYWAYQTTTGLTGVVLTLLLIVLFIFAVPYARRYAFMAFWVTHKLYFLIYPLIFIHGSVRMVQEPHFFYYVVGPVVLYTVDRLISTSRCTINLTIVKAELLPSDVTALKVKKPLGFEFKSGQWAQIAIDKLGRSEYHPFTMTSSPHEKFVTFHIRAVGPWTMNVRRLFDPANRVGKEMPKVLLDGPFGEGHQNWYKFEVAVLIGGGIGVTPFAAILKDIVHKSEMAINMQCKKVYFLWVTRTQKQFEWLTDIIRAVEAMDRKHMVTTHIFVTEFKSNFDLRTSMLYVCERHFQKICGRSLFTGLEATTHFGRPKFFTFLDGLRNTHRKVRRFGVFSCGPRPMTQGVEQACAALNKYDYATYYHHYENF